MNVEELSMIGPDVDLGTVDAINKKRLLAFVNHFVISTTMFLNKLSKSCEHGLMSLENKIQKLESSIVILESKLNSVPGLEDTNVEAPVPNVEPVLPKVESNEEKTEASIKENDSQAEKNEEDVKQEKEQSLDPALLKYVKMLHFGVPMPAVKLKMEQENVDPSLHQLVFNYNK